VLGAGLSPYILFFPVIHVIYFFLVYGVCLVLASLYVYYRDLIQIWDVILQIGFFLSPIVYPLTTVPANYMDYYMLNPITVIITMYREVLLYHQMPSEERILLTLGTGIAIMLICSAIFQRLERRFAEEI
jgi:lipopolysaccharide transport system permease protein